LARGFGGFAQNFGQKRVVERGFWVVNRGAVVVFCWFVSGGWF
jgi:hypothetical protein